MKSLMGRSSVASPQEVGLIRQYLLNYEDVCRIAPSSVLDGGRGVFVSRDVKTGDILTLYGGVQFPQPSLSVAASDMGDQETAITPVVKCSDYILNLGGLGKGYLDGHGVSIEPRKCAQIINHPPEGTRPNVDAIEFMWCSIWAETAHEKDENALKKLAMEVNPIHQGPWYHDGNFIVNTPGPGDGKAYSMLQAGIAMMAKRDLNAGEELFLDYELNESVLDDQARQWYKPVPFRF